MVKNKDQTGICKLVICCEKSLQYKIFIHAMWLFSIGLLFVSSISTAQEKQPLQTIRDAVKTQLERQIIDTKYPPDIQLGRLDPRLRLNACTTALIVTAPDELTAGRKMVSVHCPSPAWKIYLPVHISIYDEVLVAKNPLLRGTTPHKSDLTLVTRDLGKLSKGYFLNYDQLKQLTVKRAIKPGQVLNPGLLKAKKLVKNGQVVTIIANSQGLQVRSSGKALADGSAGQQIKIRNLSSKRVVEGTVLAQGLVQINTW